MTWERGTSLEPGRWAISAVTKHCLGTRCEWQEFYGQKPCPRESPWTLPAQLTSCKKWLSTLSSRKSVFAELITMKILSLGTAGEAHAAACHVYTIDRATQRLWVFPEVVCVHQRLHLGNFLKCRSKSTSLEMVVSSEWAGAGHESSCCLRQAAQTKEEDEDEASNVTAQEN